MLCIGPKLVFILFTVLYVVENLENSIFSVQRSPNIPGPLIEGRHLPIPKMRSNMYLGTCPPKFRIEKAHFYLVPTQL